MKDTGVDKIKCYLSTISLFVLLACQCCFCLQAVAQGVSRIECLFPNTRDSIECKLIIKRLNESTLVNSTIVLDGHAVFVVNLVEPCAAYLWVEHRKEDINFFIDSPNIQLLIDSLITTPVRINGSSSTKLWNQQDSTLKFLSKKQAEIQIDYNAGAWLNDSTSGSFEQFERVADSLQILYIDRITQLIIENPDMSSSWYLFASNFSSISYSIAIELFPKLVMFAEYPSYKKIRQILSRNRLGQQITDFVLPTLTANQFHLFSLRNQYILLDFSSSYLASCKRRHVYLKKMYKLYHSTGLQIITISREVDRQSTRAALLEEKLPWPVVVDTEGLSESTYQIVRMPNLLLIDRRKRIIHRDGTIQDLEAKLNKLLEQ